MKKNIAEQNLDFERSKIYEKLDHTPKPSWYKGWLPWIVQQQIAGTNGIQYVDRIGKMRDYPKYELPVEKVEHGIMLDIGCGWGRWLVAGNEKGYIPIGIDLRLEFCESSLETLKNQGAKGYAVVADLKELPFRENIFDLVWSFSVIQHTHKKRLLASLSHINRILKGGAFTKLEFPNRDGFRNRRGPVKVSASKADDYDSWVVRYYSLKEYEKFFLQIFNNFKYTVHSFLGIGVLKEDLKYVSFKNKILCGISLVLTGISKFMKPMQKKADSVYIEAKKDGMEINSTAITNFLKKHNDFPENNMNIIYLLRCPISGSTLKIKEDDFDFIYNDSESIKFPVVNGIPILIESEAVILS